MLLKGGLVFFAVQYFHIFTAEGFMWPSSSIGSKLITRATQVSVTEVLEKAKYPEHCPFSARDFARQDETADTEFYNFERFCYHIDERAVQALTKYYETTFREWEKPDILDLCASHVSHFPQDINDFAGTRVALGMNQAELEANKQCNHFIVKDLNADPRLPFDDNSFDIVTNCVSIDYLIHPLKICQEVARVLRPGGSALFSLSNRCFPSKAVDIWLRTNDLEHVFIVASYFFLYSAISTTNGTGINTGFPIMDWWYITK
uniref:Methyltransferase type 11 domain-containing protein n=1 Tax=Aureoumbra lagunensis TaxID=44058 RepID=A0A7S3JT09_9STRA